MKTSKILTMSMMAFVMASCGKSDSGGYGGLFGDLLNERYADHEESQKTQFYDDYNRKLQNSPIPMEIEDGVALQTDGVNRVDGTNFYAAAKTTHAGVYGSYTSWAKATNEDEEYEFDMRFVLLMYDANGQAIYTCPLSIYNLQRSTLQKRIVNPAGTDVQLNFSIDTRPFFANKLSSVESIKIVDRKANAETISEVERTLKEEEEAFNQRQTNEVNNK